MYALHLEMLSALAVLGFAKVWAGDLGDWPSCALENKGFRVSQPVFADVRPFIDDPDQVRNRTVTFTSDGTLGMALRDKPDALGEFVHDVIKDSQAWNSGVRKGWIITEVNGRPFSVTERLLDVGKDFDDAKREGSTLVVKFAVRTIVDCSNSNCAHSDRFPTKSMYSCAVACNDVEACQWWSLETQDADSLCVLMQDNKSGLKNIVGTFMGPRACQPKPQRGTSEAWPQCISTNAHVRMEGGPVYMDVRPFLQHFDDRHRDVVFSSEGDIGMVLRETPHEYGEVVHDVIEESQAWNVGVRKGWIIKEVDGKPFKKTEGIEDVSHDFWKAKRDAPTVRVKFDIRSFLDCTNGDCTYSDKFPATSETACADVCSQNQACGWWSFGFEDGVRKCWLRSSNRGLKAAEGSFAGSRTCSPPHAGQQYLWLAVAALLLVLLWQPAGAAALILPNMQKVSDQWVNSKELEGAMPSTMELAKVGEMDNLLSKSSSEDVMDVL